MKIVVIGQTGPRGSKVMRIDGRYDADADIASLRFEHYDPATAVPEKTDYGFREPDVAHREVVGLQYSQASRNLPAELLAMLPPARFLVSGRSNDSHRLTVCTADDLT